MLGRATQKQRSMAESRVHTDKSYGSGPQTLQNSIQAKDTINTENYIRNNVYLSSEET